MLSDSLFEAVEAIWEAVRDYSYSRDHEPKIKQALLELYVIIDKLDSPEIIGASGKKVGGTRPIQVWEQYIDERWEEEYKKNKIV